MAHWTVNIICPSCLLAVNNSENPKKYTTQEIVQQET